MELDLHAEQLLQIASQLFAARQVQPPHKLRIRLRQRMEKMP